MRMGRLAIAEAKQGKGYGRLLLGHAVNLTHSGRQTMGVRVLIVDAKDRTVAAFYQSHGFRPTTSEAFTLYLICLFEQLAAANTPVDGNF